MAARDESLGDGRRQPLRDPRRQIEVQLRDIRAQDVVNLVVVRAAQLVVRSAHDEKEVARLLEVHRHALVDVVDERHGADQQRRRDADDGAVLARELVVQGVLAGDEGGRKAIAPS